MTDGCINIKKSICGTSPPPLSPNMLFRVHVTYNINIQHTNPLPHKGWGAGLNVNVVSMGAGTGWAGRASAHPGNYLGGHCPP